MICYAETNGTLYKSSICFLDTSQYTSLMHSCFPSHLCFAFIRDRSAPPTKEAEGESASVPHAQDEDEAAHDGCANKTRIVVRLPNSRLDRGSERHSPHSRRVKEEEDVTTHLCPTTPPTPCEPTAIWILPVCTYYLLSMRMLTVCPLPVSGVL